MQSQIDNEKDNAETRKEEGQQIEDMLKTLRMNDVDQLKMEVLKLENLIKKKKL